MDKQVIKIKKGQLWKSIDTKHVVEIVGKATGMRHWITRRFDRKSPKSHHIHEGTLYKFYKLLNG